MNTVLAAKLIELGIFVIEEAVKAIPSMAVELAKLFQTADPTVKDWIAQRNKILAKLAELNKGTSPAEMNPLAQS